MISEGLAGEVLLAQQAPARLARRVVCIARAYTRPLEAGNGDLVGPGSIHGMEREDHGRRAARRDSHPGTLARLNSGLQALTPQPCTGRGGCANRCPSCCCHRRHLRRAGLLGAVAHRRRSAVQAARLCRSSAQLVCVTALLMLDDARRAGSVAKNWSRLGPGAPMVSGRANIGVEPEHAVRIVLGL